MSLEIGAQLGDYRILSRIGKGSYGVVYEAEHAITRRRDALKLMLYAGPCAADDEQRFLREIQVQASLQHPNIASVYTAFRTDWGPALAMELVRGESLRAILDRRKLPLEESIGYMQAALLGLAAAERLGIVHRDVKPENILITQDGQVKLTDFGLAHVINGARITGSGENIGTPCYMSPEQVVGDEPVDARSDVYAAGVVLYEVLTGRPPFTGTNGFAVMLAHRNTPPVAPIKINPAIGQPLNRVIMQALEKEPAKRFRNAAEFHRAVAEAIEQQPPAPAAVPDAAQRRRSRWQWALVTAAAATGCCGLLLGVAHVATRHVEAGGPVVRAKPPAPIAPPVLPPPLAKPAPTIAAQPEAPAATEPAPVPASIETEIRVKPTHRAARPRPAAAPSATLPRFTSTDAPIPSEAPPMEQAKQKVSPPAAAAFEAPAPSAPPAARPEPAIPATVASDPPPEPLEPSDAPSKHRNAVVRAFDKIFGRHSTAKTAR